MIFTFHVAAEKLILSRFIMFDSHHAAAERAFFIHRLIPKHKIAVRISVTPVKRPAALRFAFNEPSFPAAGAGYARILNDALCITAFGKIRAGKKLAETAELIHHR